MERLARYTHASDDDFSENDTAQLGTHEACNPADGEEAPATAFKETKSGQRLASIPACILMRILYAARLARYDLLRITCKLAARISKWTAYDDKRLLRLIRYIHSSLD